MIEDHCQHRFMFAREVRAAEASLVAVHRRQHRIDKTDFAFKGNSNDPRSLCGGCHLP
jgi:hypothetical protein